MSDKKVTVKVILDRDKIKSKVTNDSFGLAVTKEWKNLISPYTPRDTGRTEDTAAVAPWTITYNPVDPVTGVHYGSKIYYGTHIKFKKRYNPYATYMWDKAAIAAGKSRELYGYINNVLLK